MDGCVGNNRAARVKRKTELRWASWKGMCRRGVVEVIISMILLALHLLVDVFMIVVDGQTKRGFPWSLKMGISGKGKLTFFNQEFRCFYAVSLFDIDKCEWVPVLKVYWCDLTEYVREVYRLNPGQSLLIVIPKEKLVVFRLLTGEPEQETSDVLDFVPSFA